MMREPSPPPSSDWGARYLYLLAWHDMLERQDMLILEIRHLQVNIIYSLREPGFYRPLRYEESHLWGDSWVDEGLSEGDAGKRTAQLAAQWIPLFPDPGELCAMDAQPKEALEQDLVRLLKEVWPGGYWGRDQRRHYHHLVALQRLKREIFRDKLQLCRFALKAGLHQARETQREDKRAKFIVMRAGALQKAAGYIKQLRNFQNAFNKSMDLGLQDHPRPSIERRRELGIYMDFLSERSRDLLRDMQLLLSDLGDRTPYRKSKVIFHRWRHDFTSRNEGFDDEVGETLQDRPSEPGSIRFVNTSYYMPERPDLQPVIAHEVAHALIDDHFDNLVGPALAIGGVFSDLLATLRGSIESHRAWPGLPRGNIDANALMREIACDLLAASVKGYTYLYALFLESIGYGLEPLLMGRRGRIELEGAETLEAGPTSAPLAREWYLRLRLTAFWLEKVHHWPQGGLDPFLVEGVKAVAHDISELLDNLLPPEERARGRSWQVLTDRLCEILDEHGAGDLVKKWRGRRSEDHYLEKGAEGPREMPRSMARLDEEVRELLYEIQLGMKSKEGRLLHDPYSKSKKVPDRQEFLEQIGNAFFENYGVGHRKGKDYPRRLYRHPYDIPWQSALMRAMDVLGPPSQQKSTDQQEMLRILHQEFPLGRELFQVALEFHLWDTDSAMRRLVTVTRLIKEYKNQLESKGSSLSGCLKEWWNGEDGFLQEHKPKESELRGLLEKGEIKDKEWIKNLTERVIGEPNGKWSALLLVRLRQCVKPDQADRYRKLEKASGYALQRLADILRGQDPAIPPEDPLYPLLIYLQIHQEKDDAQVSKKDFFNRVTAAFGSTRENNTEWTLPSLNSMLLGRLSMAGSYPALREPKGKEPGDFLSLTKVLAGGALTQGSEKHEAWFRMQPLMGRYDMLLWGATRFLCRCKLPKLDRNESASETLKERWPTFFTRKEMALAVDLDEESPQTAAVPLMKERLKKRKVAAMLVVTLQRRPFRLDFLYRLLRARQQGNKAAENLNAQTLEAVGALFDPGDFAFLTDGWGDLVIVFCQARGADPLDFPGSQRKPRLSRIFAIQNAIFQDFQVDRTELILTPSVMKWVGKQLEPNGKWSVETQVRLMEDRGLMNGNDLFTKHWQEERDRYCHGCFIPELYRIPGRMDYTLKLNGAKQKEYQKKGVSLVKRKDGSCEKGSCLLPLMQKMIDDPLLDRLYTTIAMRVDDGKQ